MKQFKNIFLKILIFLGITRTKSKIDIYKSFPYLCSLKLYPEHLKVGSEVITPEGLGKIKYTVGDLVTVYLFKKYYKTFLREQIYSYFVIIPNMNKEIILTPLHSYYIMSPKQEIEFTISSKGKAKLTKEYMSKREHLAVFNSYKYGKFFLNKLEENGFTVIKK